MRIFNTEGPINVDRHYHLPRLGRVDIDRVLFLIEMRKYFVLQAPRQTGKTTTLLALRDRLNRTGRYRCLYVNVEGCQTCREDIAGVIGEIASELISQAREILPGDSLEAVWQGIPEEFGPGSRLREILVRWSAAGSKPVVLLVDEIDSLVGDSLIAVLRVFRAGHSRRPKHFPQSIILCGVRDVRDSHILSAEGNDNLLGGVFNIKAKTIRLRDFTDDDVSALLGQHVEETGQEFSAAALREVWRLTEGQPWLVNALAYQACFRNKPARDRSRPVGLDAIRQACETLILRRDTHLDHLACKLHEPRVRRVIEPLLTGSTPSLLPGDSGYVRDLGLLAPRDPLAIANPIYREVIPRELAREVQATITDEPSRYVTEDGGLLVPNLLEDIQEYFRSEAGHWVDRLGYQEAWPHLLLQAFLHRVVSSNPRGRIEREYGLGQRFTDLSVTWPVANAAATPPLVHTAAIECNLLRGSVEAAIARGLAQTSKFMARAEADEGHLVIFNRRESVTRDRKIFRRAATADGRDITVWGM